MMSGSAVVRNSITAFGFEPRAMFQLTTRNAVKPSVKSEEVNEPVSMNSITPRQGCAAHAFASALLYGKRRYDRRTRRNYSVRVQGNDPDEIRADRGCNKGDVHYVQNCERQKSIGEEAATDNKLRLTRDIHQRVPCLFVRLLLPQS